MKTGTGLAVIAIGAILAFAVRTNTSVFNLHTAGWVLIIIGIVGIAIPRRGYGWVGRRVLTRQTRLRPTRRRPGASALRSTSCNTNSSRRASASRASRSIAASTAKFHSACSIFFVMAWANVGPAAISAASCRDSFNTSSGETSRLKKPHATASSADMERPVNKSSEARP